MEPSGTIASDASVGSEAALAAQATTAAPGRAAPFGRRRTRRGAALRILSTIMLLVGLGLVADAVAVLLWQEPLSAVYARVQQDRLAGQLARTENTAPSPGQIHALAHLRNDGQRVAALAASLKRNARRGAGVGRLRIPSLGVSYLLVKGADTESLKKGPGVYSQTPFPGARGTTAVAGHRTTYLAPFRNIDRLRPGQTIRIQMPYGDFTYAIEKTRIVGPTDFSIIRSVGYPRLVLSACYPLYSAAKRIIVFARLAQPVAVRGPAFPHAAQSTAAPIGRSGAGVIALLLVAIGVLLVGPLTVYMLAIRLVRRIRSSRPGAAD